MGGHRGRSSAVDRRRSAAHPGRGHEVGGISGCLFAATVTLYVAVGTGTIVVLRLLRQTHEGPANTA